MPTISAPEALADLWHTAALPGEALDRSTLTGAEPALRSSFAVGTAGQVSIAGAALAAAELGRLRNGLAQHVAVDLRDAALECTLDFAIDGRRPDPWDPIAGLYRCGDGHVRLHTNFPHHRDGTLRLLGLSPGPGTPREAVAAALRGWRPLAFEAAAAEAGLVVAALRTFDEWDAHPQRRAVAGRPLVSIDRIGDAPPPALPPLPLDARPLAGVRVLDLTRILAGPVGGRTLAAYGADVMLVNAPHLPNIEAIADTSRGKRAALADLRAPAGRDALQRAVREAHVFVQGYRPGALERFDLGPAALAALRPGIVVVSLSAYGETGPWGGRRGFDSLVQTATGFNDAEGRAAAARSGADADAQATPRALPVQILDMATGFLIAFGAAVALHRQQREGGSWQVRVSLARTGQWLRELDRVTNGFEAPEPRPADLRETVASGFGRLTALRHAARFSHTPAGWTRPSVPPGTDALDWS